MMGESPRTAAEGSGEMHIQTSFESVAVKGGDFVNIGHIVWNFSHRVVVEGLCQHGLVVRLLDLNDNMIPVAKGGRYIATPMFCTAAGRH